MNALRWQRLDELFGRALELDPVARTQLLARESAGDPRLRQEVEALLEAHASADGFLEQPVVPSPGRRPAAAWKGRRLGPWRLVDFLGEGGMGTVFEGVRDRGDFSQRVAVKLADRIAGSASLERRFHAERSILARLEHPGIARLLDGGTSDEGVPYLVMELVDGVPLDRYCESLDLRSCLDLFLEVCDAVQHAHRHLVIHRDLKPAHILVSDEGRPKLLDFGIAKLLAQDLPGPTGDLTRTGFWALTPAYASPEQLRREQVDTASDVYSLGVVLYQVLTGRQPRQIDSLGRDDVERALAAKPQAPSTVLRQAPPGDSGPAARRVLPEDLDAVVLQALRVDPAERYPSVERFAEDLRDVLAGRPVSARRPTLAYHLLRGLQRHRLATALGVTALVVLTSFSAFTWQQARALERQRDRALHEQTTTQAVAAFLADVLRDADPARSGGRDVSVREAVDQSAQRLPERLAQQPDIHAGLLHFVGSIYRGLGAVEQARPMLQESLELRRQTQGADSPLVADTLLELCALERENGAQKTAKDACSAALAILRRAFPAADRRVIVGIYELSATLLQGFELEPAAALLEEVLALQRSDPSVPLEEIAISQARLARVWAELDRLDDATALALRAAHDLETSAIAGSARHAMAINSTANVLWMAGRAGEAEALSSRAEEMFIRAAGPNHPRLPAFRNDRALAAYDLGKTTEAAALLSEAMHEADRARAPSSFFRHMIRSNLAEILVAEGRPAEAEALLDELVAEADGGGLEALRPRVALIRGAARLALGDPVSARAAIEEALAFLRTHFPAGHSLIAEAESHLGAVLIAEGNREPGQRLLEKSRNRLAEVLGKDHPKTRAAAKRLREAQSRDARPGR